MATMVAHWVRADSALHFQRWRMEEGLIHPGVSTLMFRRTDCGPDSAHTPVVRFLLEMLPAANVSVGLFHWPDYRRLQAID